jgi:hypothetical protein
MSLGVARVSMPPLEAIRVWVEMAKKPRDQWPADRDRQGFLILLPIAWQKICALQRQEDFEESVAKRIEADAPWVGDMGDILWESAREVLRRVAPRHSQEGRLTPLDLEQQSGRLYGSDSYVAEAWAAVLDGIAALARLGSDSFAKRRAMAAVRSNAAALASAWKGNESTMANVVSRLTLDKPADTR